jgi:tyrosyl-tRNA synthetase
MVRAVMNELLTDLHWRGLVHQSTDLDALEEHLDSGQRCVYAGFDPTRDSLTIGNLVPIMLLVHFQRAGHRPVALMGGGTGLIGDPSGKSAERQLLDADAIANNVQCIRRIFDGVLGFDGPAAATVVDNLDWLGKLSYVEVLRDVGKHFAVNMMIQKESVRERLENREQGISYTEFSYMILQAYDFHHLRKHHGVSVQVGGSDQWGNIVAGIDLVRRLQHEEVFGLTAPLVTKADGGKFGKTESGAIWLSPERTSPYAFYQFWLNTADADVAKYIKIYTLLDRATIEGVLEEHDQDPSKRIAQRRLAQEATRLLHGEEGLQRAEAATNALFSGDVRGLDGQTLQEAFAEAPSSEHPKDSLSGDGMALVELLPQTSLASSKRQARELLSNSAISVNGDKASLDTKLTSADLLDGRAILLRRGRKAWHVTHWG